MELLECTLAIDDLDSFVADLGAIGETHGTTLQAFDARYVAGPRHLERAVELADRSIERGENVARDRAVEILLYAAGRRQIDRALEMGVGEGENRAVVLADGGDEAAALEDVRKLAAFAGTASTLEAPDGETLQEFFEIPDRERAVTGATLGALVRERVALLEVEK
ncbi:KEOPS complex Cgi121-like subunit [Natronococcus amylolyticus DSM 10524]|uniref:KEOPS complex Cgi121-like subunit n=1 Tax=Natronococcus amylolyticus DSM 10524 TaxID=1227497 RepID=L9XBX3_9EURY|nr:KEOPS complex subunit Cgi121 [Natronococcus amylolyticus]ELY59127.1 KEOPS complex Cgi121-like subunit [Natronococcus amylolyticus DSM 10524]